MKFFLIILLLGFSLFSPILAKELAYEPLYTSILKHHIQTGKRNKITSSLVNYKKLNESQSMQTLIRLIEHVDIEEFVTPDDAIAFWINAFNIGALKLILDFEPKNSITEINLPGSPIWDMPVLVINDQPYSLSEIKKHLLGFKDPRVHFALSPGVLSAPDLRQEAYSSEKLDAQLKDQIAKFCTNSTKGAYADPKTQTLYVSPVFGEYSEDSKNYHGIQRLINPYIPQDVSFYQLDNISFDWSLNRL